MLDKRISELNELQQASTSAVFALSEIDNVTYKYTLNSLATQVGGLISGSILSQAPTASMASGSYGAVGNTFGSVCAMYDLRVVSSGNGEPAAGQVILNTSSSLVRIHKEDVIGNDLSVFFNTKFKSKQFEMFWKSTAQTPATVSNTAGLYHDQCEDIVLSVSCSILPTAGSPSDPGLVTAPSHGQAGLPVLMAYSPTIEGLRAGGSSVSTDTYYLDPLFVRSAVADTGSALLTTQVFRRDNMTFVTEETDDSVMSYASTYLNSGSFTFDTGSYTPPALPKIYRNSSLTSEAPTGYYIFLSEYNNAGIKKNAVYYTRGSAASLYDSSFKGWDYVAPTPTGGTSTNVCTAITASRAVFQTGSSNEYFEFRYDTSKVSGSYAPSSFTESYICFDAAGLDFCIPDQASSIGGTGETVTSLVYSPDLHALAYIDEDYAINVQYLNVNSISYNSGTGVLSYIDQRGDQTDLSITAGGSIDTGSLLYSGSFNTVSNTVTLYSADQNYTLDLSGLVSAGATALTASNEGTNIATVISEFDFVGNAVTATALGTVVTVTINTGSASFDTGSLLVSSSYAGSTFTFEKGDGSTYNITLDTGSNPALIYNGPSSPTSIIPVQGMSTSTGAYSTAGGGQMVFATGDISTVSGGQLNAAQCWASTIGGGRSNQVTGCYGTIAGGLSNCVGSNWGTIAGGYDNTASGLYATVAGGEVNQASGQHSFIGGGVGNTASGIRSGILGGSSNNTNNQTEAFIIGSNLCAIASCTTYVNNLYVSGTTLSTPNIPSNTTPHFLYFDTGSGTVSYGSTGSFAGIDTGSFLYSGSFNSSTSALTLYSPNQNYNVDLSSLISAGAVALTASNEGTPIATVISEFDFVGNAVTATALGSVVTVTVNTGSAINDIDYVSNVGYSAGTLSFTGVGNAFNSSVGISAITGSSFVGASANLNQITFTRGDGTTSAVTVNTGSDTVLTINNNVNNRILTANGSTTSIDAESKLTYDPFFSVFAVNTDDLYVNASGVGINTNSPASTLDVRGDVQIGSNHGSVGTCSGILSGNTNTASSNCTVVAGGKLNSASGTYSFIGGGEANCATSNNSTIVGGNSNCAKAVGTFVGGGSQNNAHCCYSTISGGALHVASGSFSTISGGYINTTLGASAGILSGRSNTASGAYATIGAGCTNVASGSMSVVTGGGFNQADGACAFIGGGTLNKACQNLATVAGGQQNHASGSFSVVAGGLQNRAASNYATVSGGSSNTASGYYSFVGGGRGNVASTRATVAGGIENVGYGYISTISGGYLNTASGSYSFIGGGYNNLTRAESPTLAGGMFNQALSNFSTIGGGIHNYIIPTGSVFCAAGVTIAGGVGHNSSGGTFGGSSFAPPPSTCYGVRNYSTISGGYRNCALGVAATVAGGWKNAAIASGSLAGGGQCNIASGNCSVVVGGTLNLANGDRSTIGGGQANCSPGQYAVVGGGTNNCANCLASTAAGGLGSVSNNIYATVGGGQFNTASGTNSTVAGGRVNAAQGNYSYIGGGRQNTASNTYTTVGGGLFNTASAILSTVGGGCGNTASNVYSTIGGGYGNTASGFKSTVGGGYTNTASGDYSVVAGGGSDAGNTASGYGSSIIGGNNNTASGTYSTIGGGESNIASGSWSGILGGRSNDTCGYSDSFIIGSNICATAACTTFTNNLNVGGTLSKSAGSFKIPHPDPSKTQTTDLVHSFVESPTAGDNLYRFTVEIKNGYGEVDLPGYYKYLNDTDDQVWVSPANNFGRGYGVVNEDQTKVYVYTDTDGIYNILVIGTRKDQIAKDYWKGPEVPKQS